MRTHVLELDALNKPNEKPSAKHSGNKGEECPSPESRARQEEQSEQNAELRRGDGRSRRR